ncbi:ATP-grasp domain-containing protein [Patescibacteria group bacterium]|nr:ATP-grasp domain-containing protein [Patescibacteria group bacterium]MCG2694718.1 ATP-grasp domain-containing protein [Candidatus Parcubacteria bacterium]
MINKLKIAVLRGGLGDDFGVSMKSGENVIKNLSLEKYIVYDVVITREGVWYLNGSSISPTNLFRMIDFVFNSLFGDYGKREIKRILEDFRVPYVGSDSLVSSLGSNRHLTRQILKDNGIKTPYYSIIRKENYNNNLINDIFHTIPIPCVVKPTSVNCPIENIVVGSIGDLINAVEKIFEISDVILVEEFIPGKKVFCGVIDGFRNKSQYSLIPAELMEIEKEDSYHQKICPNCLGQKEKQEIQKLSIDTHNILGMKHYSHFDFVVSPKRGVYLVEVNSAPVLHNDRAFAKSLESIGSDLSEFLDHLIGLANKVR